MSVSLSKTDHDHLIDLLIGLRSFRTENGRVSLVTAVLQGAPNETKIWGRLNLSGDVRSTAEDLVSELCAAGRVRPDQESLGLLIRNLLDNFGEADEQALYLKGLIDRYGLERPAAGGGQDGTDLVTQDFEPVTVAIAAGSFQMGNPAGGSRPAWETPLHEVTLDDYRIGKFPVTCAQFAKFIYQTKRLAAPEMGWDGQRPPENWLNQPVSGVSWYEALAYCQWLSQATGRAYGLPNEAQWEKAARGTDGRAYPWGGDWDAARCSAGGPLQAVDHCPAQSTYGVYDLVGNIRQWTCSLWGENRLEPDRKYAYPWKDDERNDLSANELIRRVYRGGCATDPPGELICAARGSLAPGKAGPANKRIGFRVVLI